jgi:hypothetical protein
MDRLDAALQEGLPDWDQDNLDGTGQANVDESDISSVTSAQADPITPHNRMKSFYSTLKRKKLH